ncbi:MULTISPECIES: branched-chain amino acid ABC transporter permease [unclassified Chelatococcus]|uniref:branched-chain amino acid ABC transporter permease n=1 Tax=unclassified Chelatococcus TaxID=2638111 RepID=UPI001BCE13D0|nr:MULTISPECIES: branched-chain amino acid ABC transporter permease [unclassified Chelatococcus]CAH1661365.1 Amino acid/amide ABC transporter membrane protein 2 (HAAT family) [Hyphomicrobiales bacterium]MBS7741244.1 branched-chain amino acid ABC transporter permease [Chelatococcus sp. HY11]MBX3546274.1 branched-chain amino acid ABC transporter permease [Chelatococcus sp.]MBX3557049.1 branched-chain amino acid ABC transporter permease [Chelatococcus sp.]MCO5078067.1 branched-chain amino acid AB
MLTYILFALVIGSVYALLAQSLMLSWGLAGLVNLGLAGFFAVGAYASAMLTTWGHAPIPVGVAVAMLAGGFVGLIVCFSTLRLRDDYLAIVTLGFAEIVRLVASNEVWLTGGTDGISGIPVLVPRDAGIWFHAGSLAIIAAAVAVVYLLLRRLLRSPWGRSLRAIREDQTVASVAGKSIVRFKAQAFSLAAAIAGLAGAFYGHYTSYVAPDLFQPLITIYIFLAVTAGGNARPAGAVIGAYLLVAFLEATRFIAELAPGVSAVQAASLREIVVGLGLVLILSFRPDGLLPERSQKAPAQ